MERYQTATPALPGWFYNVDLHLFALVNQLQRAADVRGDLLEVGAYLAKSSVALGFMRRDNESLAVIDPWDSYVHLEETLEENDREHDRFGGASLEKFKENYLQFHDGLPDIRQGLSTEQLKQLPAERFRFIHIDGSHEWRVVSADVDQVLRILSPGGVVAFDDMFDRRFAGVSAAVWPACARGELVPVATTDKLYATRGPSSSVSAASVARAVEDDPELRILSRHPIFGSEVLEVTMSPPPLLGRLHRYVPPAVVDAARGRNIGTRVRRTLARLR